MDREISLLTKMGVALVLLAAAINIGFGVFTITYSSAADTVNMVNNEENLKPSPSYYTDYDNTLVTGNVVRDAIHKYGGGDLAVLVSTTLHNSYCAGEYNNTGAALSLQTVYYANSNDVPTVNAYYYETGNPYQIKTAKGNYTDLSFINYGRILGVRTDQIGAVYGTEYTFDNVEYEVTELRVDSGTGRLISTKGFVADNTDRDLYNNYFSNVNALGRIEYIDSHGKFRSYLVVSDSGEVLGIAFLQVPNTTINLLNQTSGVQVVNP